MKKFSRSSNDRKLKTEKSQVSLNQDLNQIFSKYEGSKNDKKYRGVIIFHEILSKLLADRQKVFFSKLFKNNQTVKTKMKNLVRIVNNLQFRQMKMSFFKLKLRRKDWHLKLKACKLLDSMSRLLIINHKKNCLKQLQSSSHSENIKRLKVLEKYANDNKFPPKFIEQLKKNLKINLKNQKMYIENLKINVLPSLEFGDQNHSRKKIQSDSEIIIDSFRNSIKMVDELYQKLEAQKKNNQNSLEKLKTEKQITQNLTEIKKIVTKINQLYEQIEAQKVKKVSNSAQKSLLKFIEQQIDIYVKKPEKQIYPLPLKTIKSLLQDSLNNKIITQNKVSGEDVSDTKILNSIFKKYENILKKKITDTHKLSDRQKLEILGETLSHISSQNKQLQLKLDFLNKQKEKQVIKEGSFSSDQKIIQEQAKTIKYLQNLIEENEKKFNENKIGHNTRQNQKINLCELQQEKKTYSNMSKQLQEKNKLIKAKDQQIYEQKQAEKKLASSNRSRGKTLDKIKAEYQKLGQNIIRTQNDQAERRKSLSSVMRSISKQKSVGPKKNERLKIDQRISGYKRDMSHLVKMLNDIITKVTNTASNNPQIVSQLSEISDTCCHEDVYQRLQSFAVMYILQSLNRDNKQQKNRLQKNMQEVKLNINNTSKINLSRQSGIMRTPKRSERSHQLEKTIKK